MKRKTSYATLFVAAFRLLEAKTCLMQSAYASQNSRARYFINHRGLG